MDMKKERFPVILERAPAFAFLVGVQSVEHSDKILLDIKLNVMCCPIVVTPCLESCHGLEFFGFLAKIFAINLAKNCKNFIGFLSTIVKKLEKC